MTTRRTVVRFSFARTDVRVEYNSLAIGRRGTLIALGTNKTTPYCVNATLKSPASPNPSRSAMKLLWNKNASRRRDVETRRGPKKKPRVRKDFRSREKPRRTPSLLSVRKTKPNRVTDKLNKTVIVSTVLRNGSNFERSALRN